MLIQGEEVREGLDAHARTSEVIEIERMERLARMMPEKARAIYDNLLMGWRAPMSAAEAKRLTYGRRIP